MHLSKGRAFIRNISTIMRSLHDIYDIEYQEAGLIKSRDAVLRRIVENPGSTQEQLANNLKMGKSTISKILVILKKDGYITKVTPEENQRVKLVYPTQKGIDAYQLITTVLNEAIEKCVYPLFTEDEMTFLVEATKKIRKEVEQYWYDKKCEYQHMPKSKYLDALHDDEDEDDI